MAAIDALDYSPTTGKRATHEALEVTPRDGWVEVRNASYGDDAGDHTYRVDVDADGVPVRCDCPADAFHDGACKHRVRAALAEPVLEAATPTAATDGGAVATDDVDEEALDEDDDQADAGDDAPAVTRHREPAAQGGAEYWRCESCGAEVVADLGRDELLHRDGCPGATGGSA